jgi:predicted ABC-type ATPase
MSNPVLFIVAGPNGSGKSLFSKEFTVSDLEVFDGDKHMAALIKKYPETGSEALWSFINENIFEEQKREALEARLNYAFETNFSSADPMKTAREFKKAGYEIHLLFMGLNSLGESIERVAYRVSKGGHKVSEESIRYNFEFGHKNLYEFVTEFDTVILFDNGIASIDEPVEPQEILHIIKGKVYLNVKDYPAWVEPVLAKYQGLNLE